MPYSIYQSPSLSIARVSPPWSALIFSNSAGPHQGLSCEPYNVPRQELLLSLSSLFSSSHPRRWSRNGPPACPHIASVTTAAHPQIDTCHCDLVVKRGTNRKYYSISQKSSILSISGANECLWFRLIRTISVEPLLTAFCSMGTSPLFSKACHPVEGHTRRLFDRQNLGISACWKMDFSFYSKWRAGERILHLSRVAPLSDLSLVLWRRVCSILLARAPIKLSFAHDNDSGILFFVLGKEVAR